MRAIGTQFQRSEPTLPNPKEGASPRKEPVFKSAWKATFEVAVVDGALLAKGETEAPAAVEQGGQVVTVRLPATSAGELRVEVDGAIWVNERLVGAASASRAEVVEGRVVYAAAKRGVDRVYEITAQRVEEHLRLADARAAEELSWEVETGPAIADLVVDGSGFGLVAVDAAGKALLKAPQPLGVDAKGEPVQGRLLTERVSEHRFILRVELTAGAPTFPVLLDPSWVSTGSMAVFRSFHGAVLLQSGKVLVAGGSGGSVLSSAELYDPATGTWSATGPLSAARWAHTATLLGNGKVLVAGGQTAGPTATAELYDPVAGTWSVTGSMPNYHYFHAAALLANGKVLVLGGNTGVSGNPAELYDPVSGTWTATGSLSAMRQLPTATLLANGKVLATGGGTATSTELYDPAAGTWSATGAMAIGRYRATATLLQNGKVLVAAGTTFAVDVSSAELYDPAAGTWSTSGSMAAGRYGHTATMLLNGKVVVAGGLNVSTILASAELYDPAAGTWSAAGALAVARYTHTATLLPNGKVLVAGGSTTVAANGATAELFLVGLGQPCSLPADCATGFCSDGVCCDTACGAGCDVCNAVGTVGTCTNAPLGSAGSPSCTPYLCSGAAACPVSCTVDAQCVAGQYCDGSACLPKKALGVVCVLANECVSANCVDGVCCDTSCAGSCNACNLASSMGTCTDAPAGSAGNPACAPYVCSGAAVSCPVSCTVDTQCVAGQYCSGTACLPKSPLGTVCSAANSCVSGNCVDGVCCNTACAGGCDACNLAGTTGTCTPSPAGSAGSPSCTPYVCSGASASCPGSCTADAQCVAGQYCNGTACVPKLVGGTTCSGATACVSGNCVDGVCCNSACLGACDACNLVGTAGTCTSTPAGTSGSPACAPYVCTGTSATCPVSCTVDAQCVAGQYCSGAACVPQKIPGITCGAASECLSGNCVDGVCCDTGCAGACNACNLVGTIGICTNTPAGSSGSPSCAPLLCAGTSPSCPGGCTTDAECVAGRYCDGSACLPRKTPGATCTGANACLSGQCVDGVCCDTACAGACDACNLAGTEGTCTNAPPGVAGSPTCAPYVCAGASANCPSACTDDTPCAAGQHCSGSACVPQKIPGTSCSGASECLSGHCVDGVCCATACDGACDACNLPGTGGTCSNDPAGSAGSPACAPYLCAGDSAACPSACAVDAQCAAGTNCVSGACVAPRPNGGACTSNAQCVSGLCVDGFCCNSACAGTCDACNVAGKEGQCVFAPIATQGTPSCTPYTCPGDSPSCPSACVDDSACAPGNVCIEGQCTAASAADAGVGPRSYAGWSCGCDADPGSAGPAWVALLAALALFRSRRRGVRS